VLPKLLKSNIANLERILNDLFVLYEWTLKWIRKAIKQILEQSFISKIPKKRSIILKEERKLREDLIEEVKDLDEQELLILMELTKSSPLKLQWFPLNETASSLAKKMDLENSEVEKILKEIAEKGILTLGVTF